jgi:hypothetical protein
MTEEITEETPKAPSGPVLIMAKRAKNGMLILTAPNLDDYPCATDEQISEAVNAIVDDPDQPRAQQASVSYEASAEPPSNGRSFIDEDMDDDPAYGGLSEKLVVEGISFLLDKARQASK